jgi:CheY-like chemotaxis protein/two-component sensor histidine kinase
MLLKEELAELKSLGANERATLDELISTAIHSGERVTRLVGDLQAFTRIHQHGGEGVDVAAVIDSALQLLTNELRFRGRIERQFAPVPRVAASEARLGQILLHLLLNAAQSFEERATVDHVVTLRVRPAEGDAVLIEVNDNGRGIAPADLRRLFEPFFTTKPPARHAGLGLFLCRGIIENMDGRIEVESALGAGTTVRITLPALPAEAAPTEEPFSREPMPPRRANVLIVDDEQALLTALKRALKREHEVEGFVSAAEALERFRAGQRFDVILCDLMMPEMSGMDLYEQLRNEVPEQAQRMVFLTGGAFTSRARDFLRDVENPRLEKPVEIEALRALVRDRLR